MPGLLVDDILIVADGDDMLINFAEALDATHQYLFDTGGSVASHRSYNFTNSSKARSWLKNHVWWHIKEKVAVLSHFKYLGGHISATAKMQSMVPKARFAKAAAVASTDC